MIKDDELLNIFFEEAEDLIQSIMDFLSNWKTDIENCVYLISIQRELHTLKGGARMVNQQEIATLAHELESHYEKILQNKTPLDNLQYEKIMQEIDKLSDLIESLNPLKIINQLKEVPSELKMLNEGSGLSMQADAFEKNSTIQYETKKIEGVIRVKAQLLEEVNNTLSEVSMFHVHVGQQVSLVTTHLLEMEGVAKRLIEQLKQLDSQLETPIHNKEIKSLGFKVLDFDATDLDKFSESQQLTRMLGETTSDLLNIWENLFETKSIAESYILNQSRLINDLKMQILNTRMVPFSSILTRLNRIVRNVSLELNKKINFEVIKTDEELEKTVLERLLPCLEHMLRNSLDHGIESREKRLELGKNEIGKVTIELQRIGTDIHIDIKDDGAGINVEAVKKKAIDLGFFSSDSTLSMSEILQCILQPGFSTRDKISQNSGRGIGLDVVQNEIKRLNGSISLASQLNKGTVISIKIPYTNSVTKALFFNLSNHMYGIPIAHIEGIGRIPVQSLKSYMQYDAPTLEYDGKTYRLIHLKELLNTALEFEKTYQKYFPVIFLKSPIFQIGIIVDTLVGRREVVIKTLGAQFNHLEEIIGGTIMNDGHVVLMLDASSLAVKAKINLSTREINKENIIFLPNFIPKKNTVMVVDDSLTVRKVTSNFLERNNFKVICAKDGLDALLLLSRDKPDVILLDVEMPKMDGFEFATVCKNDPQFKNIPIIMITTRIGTKHQQKALSLGINHFMSKPYSEPHLLELLLELIPKNKGLL